MRRPSRKTLLFVCIPTLIAISLVAWGTAHIVSLANYGQRSNRILQKIQALESRRPKDVDSQVWNSLVTWAGIAAANICFSESHTTYQAMSEFDEALDEKLKEEVNIETLRWIGERLSETGPHGQQYMQRWWEQWNETMEYHSENRKT